MITVFPNSDYPIVRQLKDPTDAGTNYVQLIVRNTSDGVIDDTINLTDEGGQRFTGSWRAPADPSGRGLYFDFETTVYTDSGYTIKSENYLIESNDVLVDLRYGAASRVFGGNVSRGLTKKELEKILEKFRGELKLEPQDLTEFNIKLDRILLAAQANNIKPADLNILRGEVREVFALVNSLPKEFKQEEANLEPILEAIRSIVKLNSITSVIQNSEKDLGETLAKRNKELLANVTVLLKRHMKDASEIIQGAADKIGKVEFKIKAEEVISTKEDNTKRRSRRLLS